MNREQDAGKSQSKHISMELTADGARLVNLSLDGSRLVLTIEADLAGSQLRSVPPGGSVPGAHRAGQDKSDTEFMYAAHSGLAVSGGALDDTVVADMDADVMRDTTGEKSFSGGFTATPAQPTPAIAPLPAQPESVYPATETWNVAEPEDDAFTGEGDASPERLAVSSTPHPASETQAALLPGITDTDQAGGLYQPAVKPAQAAQPVQSTQPTQPVQPAVQQAAQSPLPVQPVLPEPPAISEESAAIGGARHGEPQPGIAFGVEPPAAIEPAPAAAPAPAPVPEPAPIPDSLPHYGDNFATLPAGLDNSSPRSKAPEAAGTTVLIRYTCPKCKTQGMQAVDKVGTVVNCSNCGKAMRLVIKK